MALRASAFALAAVLISSAAIAAPEPVEIPNGDLTLHATLYRPDGPGPFPAVVALHDCGGLKQRPNTEAQLYSVWANKLVADGFVVLFPDSFGSRGLGSQCRERHRTVHAWRERVADANAARLWLQAQNYVRADHISLLGWSNGAVAALWTVRLTTLPHAETADFRSAVAFYPSCQRLQQAAWSARVPTLILIGGADDWTPAAPCQQMVADAHGRSARVQIIVYPDAHHEFDRENSPIRVRTGLVNTVDPSGIAHGGTNPAARGDAFTRVPQWLAR
ncbi:MAG TPA: dienelactone hydrolase family protein [Xanthobacteraceae bacterium]|nr:dienelactone hydrolase family protein [Xanthobacteraceae bacterium]